jgi:ketosteroid isomerase-like protein
MTARRNAADAGSKRNRESDSVRAEIEEVYARTAEAVRNKDVRSIVSQMTDDATSEGLDGESLGRDEWAADIERDFAGIEAFDRADYKIEKLVVKDTESIVYVTEKFSGVLAGTRESPSEKFSSTMLARDVFQRTPSGWKVKHSETITDHMEIEGKKFTSSVYAQ